MYTIEEQARHLPKGKVKVKTISNGLLRIALKRAAVSAAVLGLSASLAGCGGVSAGNGERRILKLTDSAEESAGKRQDPNGETAGTGQNPSGKTAGAGQEPYGEAARPEKQDPAGNRSGSGNTSASAEEVKDTSAKVVVYVCGAVNRPGVYALPEGSRGKEALEAAGGFTENAEPASVNLAEFVSDGQMLYISEKGETTGAAVTGISGIPGMAGGGKINLNTADSSALKTLPGVGDSRAADIIRYREEHGNFRRIEDLMKVPGIKEKGFERLKDRITV